MTNESFNKIIAFIKLLLKWNEKINLISIKTLDELFINHILDSLSIIEFFPSTPNKVYDIGPGAGFPGIILSILKPENSFILLEPEKKYFIFLKKVIQDLKLSNIILINKKIEEYQGEIPEPFDMILNRAVKEINYIYQISKNLRNSDKVPIFFFKGINFFNEIKSIKRITTFIVVIKKIKLLEIYNKNHYIVSIK